MMKRLLAMAASMALSATVAGSAGADAVAGWDFSQYFSDSVLSTDGTTYTAVLPANYSSLDTTHNAGAESASFGTAWFDGSNGSTPVAAGSGSEVFIPTAGSLRSNIDGSASVIGTNSFDAHSVLRAEGQTFTERLAMTAPGAVSVVFGADLSSTPQGANNWQLSFGGKTISGTSTVQVEFSTDGSSYTSFGSVGLDESDTGYTVALDNVTSDTAFVRLSLDPSLGQPIIDNVAIHATPVPEPGAVAMLLAGVAALWVLPRRAGIHPRA